MTGIDPRRRGGPSGKGILEPTNTGSGSPAHTGTGAAFPGLFGTQNPLASYEKPIPTAFPSMPRLSHEPLGLQPPEQPMMGLGSYAAPGMAGNASIAGMPIFDPKNRPSTPSPNSFGGFGNDMVFPTGDPRGTSQPPNPYYVAPPTSGPTAPKPFVGMGNDMVQKPAPPPRGKLIPSSSPRSKPTMSDEDSLFWEPSGGSGGSSGSRGTGGGGPKISQSSPAGRVSNFPQGNSPLTPPAGRLTNAGGYAHMPFGSGQDANKAMQGGPTIFDIGGNSLHNYGTPDALFTYEQQQKLMADQLGNRFNQNSRSGANAGPGGVGMAVYGGGGGFADALNAANQANLDRYNEINGGYTAGRRRSDELLGKLGEQQRRDTDSTFDRNRGSITQGMINRGLTNTTVTNNALTGNERDRASALARLEEQLTRQRLDTEYGQLQDQLGFMERRNDQAPNLDRMARLMQEAAAGGYGGGGGGGGGPGFASVDMSGYGGGYFGGGYMAPMGGANIQPRGGRNGPQAGNWNRGVDDMLRRMWGGGGSPRGPIVYGPGGGRSEGYGTTFGPGTADDMGFTGWEEGGMPGGFGEGSASGASGLMGGAGARPGYFGSAMRGLASTMGRGADTFGDTVSRYLDPQRLNAPLYSHSSWMADFPALQQWLYR
jgi:hypothetical protein